MLAAAGADYDVRSFAPEGNERLLEVKTTNGSAGMPFFLSRNELGIAKESPEDRAHLPRSALRQHTAHLYNRAPGGRGPPAPRAQALGILKNCSGQTLRLAIIPSFSISHRSPE